MKRLLYLSMLLLTCCTRPDVDGSLVKLRGDAFSFDTKTAPDVVLPAESGPFQGSFLDTPEDGFTMVIPLTLSDFTNDTELLCIPGTINVRLRQHFPRDIERQNYPAGKMPDGRCPVLEATLTLWPPFSNSSQDMTIGVPLGLLPRPWGKHELVLHFTGAAWEMYLDSRLADRDFAFGYPRRQEPRQVRINGDYVGQTRIWTPSLSARPKKQKAEFAEAQYFTPRGHNTWTGDVAAIWHKGRYHIFYLLDRRGHSSKFGRGGHYFEHLSTTDFKHWTEHEAATPIEEQWETFGTGVPFVWHDSLMISYGMHTSRLYPYEKTASPREWAHIREFGCSEVIPFDDLDSLVPSGCTFSVSRDGIGNFEKSRLIIHPSENPTIYYDKDGRLCMLANYASKGTWTADDLRGPWRCISEDFPPGHDCTFFFEWGDWEYIVGGFVEMWKKPLDAGIDEFEDLSAQGLDFYDGLCVPSVVQIGDGRYLSAGWVRVNGHWGGPLVIRELLQYPDGIIGSRFMPEMMPLVCSARQLAEAVEDGDSFETGCRSFMLTFDVEPSPDGRMSLQFGSGKRACQWDLDVAGCRAQFSDDGSRQPSMREGGRPYNAWNYAIENIRSLDNPFQIRIIVKGEPKWGGSLVDVEIAGQRTMITDRYALEVDTLAFSIGGVTVKNLMLSPLKGSN